MPVLHAVVGIGVAIAVACIAAGVLLVRARRLHNASIKVNGINVGIMSSPLESFSNPLESFKWSVADGLSDDGEEDQQPKGKKDRAGGPWILESFAWSSVAEGDADGLSDDGQEDQQPKRNKDHAGGLAGWLAGRSRTTIFPTNNTIFPTNNVFKSNSFSNTHGVRGRSDTTQPQSQLDKELLSALQSLEANSDEEEAAGLSLAQRVARVKHERHAPRGPLTGSLRELHSNRSRNA